MERKIFVYENFSSLEPKKLGVLYVDTLRGIEHYSFEYDQDWLKQSKSVSYTHLTLPTN